MTRTAQATSQAFETPASSPPHSPSSAATSQTKLGCLHGFQGVPQRLVTSNRGSSYTIGLSTPWGTKPTWRSDPKAADGTHRCHEILWLLGHIPTATVNVTRGSHEGVIDLRRR
ncbi:uncharacterized protein LOC133803371 [Humulus lupulus]|uniref:uncharacterized protein LOC133803371 n=1 Tax=Humulus lupulus TaxID=3486 RepID=UPI002B402B7A|nr:uncharacterized protein LOC133803371 [Humulus lupulus]